MSVPKIDFVVYLGDPDEGAASMTSTQLLAEADQHKDELSFPDVYGAITLTEGDDALLPLHPDPIFGLVTHFVRAVNSMIDGDPESLRLAESEHGFSIEPNGDDVMLSMFAGDPYEPDEFYLEDKAMPFVEFGEQVLQMGQRLFDIQKKVDPEGLAEDDYLEGLKSFLELSGDAFKTFKLEKQHGLRA